MGDFVFLKASPWKGALRIKGRGKLSARFLGPSEIIERVGACAYRLLLPVELSRIHDVFHVSNLRKYKADPSHVLKASELEVRENLTYAELPLRIVDRKEQVLRSKTIVWVKVVWRNHGVEEATWEGEEEMRPRYPFLFTSGTFSFLKFRGRNSLSGGEL